MILQKIVKKIGFQTIVFVDRFAALEYILVLHSCECFHCALHWIILIYEDEQQKDTIWTERNPENIQ